MSDISIRAIIGDGIPTELLITSALKQLDANPVEVYVFSKNEIRRRELSQRYGVKTFENPQLLSKAQIVTIAIFPDEFQKIIPQIKDFVAKDALIVSMVYGLTISELEKIFPNRPVIRVIANPFMISGVGTCAYTTGSINSADADGIAQMILSAFGKIIKVNTEEELQNVQDVTFAETILSYHLIESMIEGSMKAGLTSEKSIEIVTQVLAGAIATITDKDAKSKEFIDNAKNDKASQLMINHAKEIIDKYHMWGLLKDSYDDKTPPNSKILKLHYHW